MLFEFFRAEEKKRKVTGMSESYARFLIMYKFFDSVVM